MVQPTDIEGALWHLHIRYRRKALRDGVLFFCDSPGKQTFNLECTEDGALHLWRFLPADIPEGYAGKKIEDVCGPRVTGLEITEDNILNFYIREMIDPHGSLEHLQHVIWDFLRRSVRIQQHFSKLLPA